MTLTLERIAPTSARVTRFFATSPGRLWTAHTDPDILRHWMLGPEGWVMTECRSDARPGGKIAYSWQDESTGASLSLTGAYLTLEPPHRIVHAERFHLPEKTPENTCETVFEPEGDGTQMTLTMSVDTADIMDEMLATGMTDGMEASYGRLDALLPRLLPPD